MASHWCRDCAEPLCESCLKYHRLMKISRRHKIDEMDSVKRYPKRMLSAPQPCPDHVGKDIELFCADHNTLCCVMCVATEHRRCEKVASIEKLAKQLEEGAVTEELVDKLNSYLDHLSVMKKDRQLNIEGLNIKKNEILDQVGAYKENINILLEKLEDTLKGKLENIQATEMAKLASQVDWCDAITSAVENAKTVLLMTNRHCSNAQVFITVQQCIERSIKYEDEIAKEQNDIFELIDYSFEIDNAFEAFLQSLINVEAVGKVHTHRRHAFLPSSPGLKLLRDRSAEKVIEFSCKTQSDSRNCCLSSVLFLSDRRLLLADQNNQKVKLFKDDGILVYEQSFTTWPRDLTELGDNKIAVTLPKARKIEIFYLGEKIKHLETIRLQAECWGITYSTHLIVGCIGSETGHLKFLSMEGEEVNTVENDQNGDRLFMKTNYVTTSVDGSLIYVTDRTKDTVVALTLKKSITKPPVSTEDQGPRQVVPSYEPKQRSSTMLDYVQRRNVKIQNTEPDKVNFSKSLPLPSDINRSLISKSTRETASSPIKFEDTILETTEESFERSSKVTEQYDKKSSTQDERGSLKTEYLDPAIPRVSPIERMNSMSVVSDQENQDSVEYDVLFSYSNDILKSAGGVAVDHQGNIYVCGYRSSNVHQVSPGGSLIKVLLENLSQPLALTVEPYGERLAVTETTSPKQNYVQIYRLV